MQVLHFRVRLAWSCHESMANVQFSYKSHNIHKWHAWCTRSSLEPCRTTLENMAKRLTCFHSPRRPKMYRKRSMYRLYRLYRHHVEWFSAQLAMLPQVFHVHVCLLSVSSNRSWTMWRTPRRRRWSGQPFSVLVADTYNARTCVQYTLYSI
jgi:hypothetical protein